MEISNFTFIVTDDCNFNCSYCFQKKEKKTINNHTIERAVDFFYPYLKSNEKIYINFYGGEPLLAFEKIKHTVFLLSEKNKTAVENKKLKGAALTGSGEEICEKNMEFAVTTNGSLLTDEMLDFFDRYKFALTLSFDGLAQEIGRKKGTMKQMERLIQKIQTYPGIKFEINSVFSPQTISAFSRSMRFILKQGEPETTFNFTATEGWTAEQLETLENELEQFTDYMAGYYKKKGTMPITNFRSALEKEKKKKGIFQCSAGKNRMAVTPEGKVWGCFLFHDYFKTRQESPQYKDYYFGTLNDFTANYETCYPEILAHYAELRQDFFQVEGNFCFLCEEIEGCVICPLNAAYTSGGLGRISCCKCKLEKIQSAARRNLQQKICC
jgi:sulfatase maturation enzyme AslB (radical SAM superfamily)